MRGRRDPGRAMHVEPDVVVATEGAFAGVQAHADADGPTSAGQASVASARWAASRAATRRGADGKTTKNESPSVATSTPPASLERRPQQRLVALEHAADSRLPDAAPAASSPRCR